MKDRIETTYIAVDEMIKFHGNPRPEKFGGGTWDAPEEFAYYKEQIGERYTKLQWTIIELYFKNKFVEVQIPLRECLRWILFRVP